MIKIKYLLIVAIAAITVISCKQQAQVDYAIISGKISNKVAGEITFFHMDGTKKTLNVAEDGKFIDTLFRVKTGMYRLLDGKYGVGVYLDAGDNITVNYDATDFMNTITILGIGSEISNYILAKRKKSMSDPISYELEEADFKAKNRDLKFVFEGLLSSAEGISEEFREKEKRNLNYSYLFRFLLYQRTHAFLTKKPDFKVSEGFLNELDGLTYDNEEDFFSSSSYNLLVRTHYGYQTDELAKSASIENDIAFFKTVGVSTNETIKNNLLFGKAKKGITHTENLEGYYNAFIAASSDQDHIKKITESYNKLKTVVEGQLSPKFEGYENFAGGTTSLDDLKGKYVYIDVWATWCFPCKNQIPFLKEVEKKYHGKNIVFVSISVDKDIDKWKKMLEEEELGGIQLFADKDFESDFIKGYVIKTIPRFILIDPNGLIVTPNALRPSDDKLIDLFNELNI